MSDWDYCPCCQPEVEDEFPVYGPRPEPTEMEKFMLREGLKMLNQRFKFYGLPETKVGTTIKIRKPQSYKVGQA
jgi:hypothetical protein